MIDDTDSKIIKLLENNARASFAEISQKVFLSPSSVRDRIKKMEDTGLIKRFTIEVDQTMIGNSLEVFIMLKIFSGKFESAVSAISSYQEVKKAYRITGQQNIHMRVALRNQLHLQQFIDKLLNFGEPTTHLILSELPKTE